MTIMNHYHKYTYLKMCLRALQETSNSIRGRAQIQFEAGLELNILDGAKILFVIKFAFQRCVYKM